MLICVKTKSMQHLSNMPLFLLYAFICINFFLCFSYRITPMKAAYTQKIYNYRFNLLRIIPIYMICLWIIVYSVQSRRVPSTRHHGLQEPRVFPARQQGSNGYPNAVCHRCSRRRLHVAGQRRRSCCKYTLWSLKTNMWSIK